MPVVRPFGNIETLMICHSDSNVYAALVAQHLAYLSLAVRFEVSAVTMLLRRGHTIRAELDCRLS